LIKTFSAGGQVSKKKQTELALPSAFLEHTKKGIFTSNNEKEES
jgi:peptide methionine sulfoxide reductase MsrB